MRTTIAHRVAGAALLAVLATPVGSVAKTAPSPGVGVLRLRSSGGSGYAEVTLRRRLQIPHSWATLFPTSVRGCGRYAGFLFESLATGRTEGRVDVRDFDHGPVPRVLLPLGDLATQAWPRHVDLRPGRYRVYLFGEGRCDIGVATWGPSPNFGPSLDVTVRTRIPVSFATRAGTLVPGPPGLPQAAQVDLPVTIGPRTVALVAAHLHYFYARPIEVLPHSVDACLEPTGPVCAHRVGLGGYRDFESGSEVHSNFTSDSVFVAYAAAAPGDLEPGDYRGTTLVAAREGQRSILTAVFAAELPG